MSNLENALQIGGYLGGIPKQKYLDMERRAINGEAIADITDRTTGASGFFYDLFDNTNDHSCGVLDTTKTTAISPLTAGDTNIISKVDTSTALTKWFQTGQEITIQQKNDDGVTETKEYVTVTNGGISEDSVTYDRSTPTTVVSSAYTTSSNARPQVLSNGWIVTCANDTVNHKLYFYVNKDNGATTPTQLCYSTYTMTNFAITSYGTRIFCHFTEATYAEFFSFDATTVTNININNQTALSNPISIGSGCSITVNSIGTELHVSFCEKNSTYPNSFNIRYAKGTISAVDGSVSWGSVEQVTIQNTSGRDFTSPSIIISNTIPCITFQSSYTAFKDDNTNYVSQSAILLLKRDTSLPYNNSTIINPALVNLWHGKTIYTDSSTYTQSSPDLISDQNGILWCVWEGLDSTDTGQTNIHCKYSNDGGIIWVNANGVTDKLTSGNVASQNRPSICDNLEGNIWIIWDGQISSTSDMRIIKQITYNGITWSEIQNLTTQGSGHDLYPSTVNNYKDFSQPLLIWKDENASVKFRGVFIQTTQVPHLEVTPLQNNYETNVLIYRSLGNIDTVNGKLGFSEGFQSTTTYDRSTPTTVVGSAYDTSGNGGRKLVRLSNGWLVSSALNGNTIQFYVSKNNGETTQVLCYYSVGSNTSFAISSYNNIVYVVATVPTNTSALMSKFDATTITNVNINTLFEKLIDTSQTSFGSGCSLTIDSLGYLYATWCSKNNSYPNSFNIRYSKSTDGGVTWSAVTQVSVNNTSGQDNTNPCIVINANKPSILYQYSSASSPYIIRVQNFNGISTWTQVDVFTYNNTNYTQSNPSAAVDNAGVIHVVWDGLDSTDTTKYNIRYSKSTDGGTTWSAMLKLTTGNIKNSRRPSITINKNGEIYVVFDGEDVDDNYFGIKYIKYSSSAWGSITIIANGVTNNKLYVSSLADNTLDFSKPLFIYQDSVSSKVGFYGTWQDTSYIGLNEESVIYNITPPVSSGEIASWVKYSNSSDFSIDSKFSIKSSGNEVFLNPTKITTVIDADYKEDQYIISAPVGSQIAQKIVMTRTNSTVEKYVYQVLGALG